MALNWTTASSALYDAYGPQWSSTIYAPTNQYQVLLEMMPEYQQHADAVTLIYLKSDAGQLVPLDAVARLTQDAGPQTITAFGPAALRDGLVQLEAGHVARAGRGRVEEPATSQPPGHHHRHLPGHGQGVPGFAAEHGHAAAHRHAVVYIVLGVLYESYIHPLTILSGLPSAGFGALLTLLLFKIDLNIYSFVGLIMLIGIVKKNAIMQIDFALEAERKEGRTPAEAICEGCLIRFRPIMMTTMAALLGGAAHRAGIRLGRGGAPAAGHGRGGRPGLLAVDDSVPDAHGVYLHGGHPAALARRGNPARVRVARLSQAGD